VAPQFSFDVAALTLRSSSVPRQLFALYTHTTHIYNIMHIYTRITHVYTRYVYVHASMQYVYYINKRTRLVKVRCLHPSRYHLHFGEKTTHTGANLCVCVYVRVLVYNGTNVSNVCVRSIK